MTRITTLDPSVYRQIPWKNGGGIAVDIAGASRPGTESEAWGNTLWRLGRTRIATGAPFSDLSGFDRLQMVVAGRGLVLQTPDGDIDEREPFVPVRFAGELAIVSRLEAGPVEVVNLMADRSAATIDLAMLEAGHQATLKAGIHLFYAAQDACALRCDGLRHAVASGHALRMDGDAAIVVEGLSGRLLMGSVFLR